MDADDLKSGVERTALPFPAVDAAPLDDGVAVVSADGRAAIIGCERRVLEIGDATSPSPIAAKTRIVDGRMVTVSFADDGCPRFRIFDFVSKTVDSFTYSSLLQKGNEMEAFLRVNSVCVVNDKKIVELAFENSRGSEILRIGRGKGEVEIGEGE